MRPAAALALLLLAGPLLAGCLEGGTGSPQGVPEGGADRGAFSTSRPPVALHAWSTCGFCPPPEGFDAPQQRLFAMDANGSAVLLHLNSGEGARRIEIHPDVRLPRAEVERLVEAAGVREWLGSPAVFVAREERAAVPGPERDALLEALRDSWEGPEPGSATPCADCVGPGLFARMMDGRVDRIDATPPGIAVEGPFSRLLRAFQDAERAMEGPGAPTTTTTPGSPTIPPQEFEMRRPLRQECARLDVSVEPSTLAPGEGADVTARLVNVCDEPGQVQGASGCAMEGLEATLHVEGRTYHLTPEGAAHERLACTAILPAPVTVPAGGAHEVAWRWNGTLAQVRDDACCERYAEAPPGSWEAVARVVTPRDLPPANATFEVRAP